MGVQSKVGPQWLPLPNTQPVAEVLDAYPTPLRQDALDAIDILYDEIVNQYRYAAPGNIWAGSRWIGSFLISFGVGHELFDILNIVYDQPGDEDPGFFAVLRGLQLTRHAMPSRESGPSCRIAGGFEAFAEVFSSRTMTDPIIVSSLSLDRIGDFNEFDDLDLSLASRVHSFGPERVINIPIFGWPDNDHGNAIGVRDHDIYLYGNRDVRDHLGPVIWDELRSRRMHHGLDGNSYGQHALQLLSTLMINGRELSLIEQMVIGEILARDFPASQKFAFLAAMIGRFRASSADNQSERFGARP